MDIDQLATRTSGCTGADLKPLAEDARNLLAFDFSRGKPTRSVTEYFLDALATLRVNQEKYARLSGKHQYPLTPDPHIAAGSCRPA